MNIYNNLLQQWFDLEILADENCFKEVLLIMLHYLQ